MKGKDEIRWPLNQNVFPKYKNLLLLLIVVNYNSQIALEDNI